MGMKIAKKTGIGAIYFVIGGLVNYFANMFGHGNIGGNGYSFTSILLIGIALCAISRYLRIGTLKANHKGDESEEKEVFNGDLKSKLKFIVTSTDFKIEAVLFVIFTVIVLAIPALETISYYGAAMVFANKSNIAILIGGIVLLPIYMAIIDIISWLMAYNVCYKRKEF